MDIKPWDWWDHGKFPFFIEKKVNEDPYYQTRCFLALDEIVIEYKGAIL